MARGIKKGPVVVQPDLSPAGEWEVSGAGTRGPLGTFDTKAEAVEAAREELEISHYPAMVVRDGNGDTQYITLNSDVLKNEEYWQKTGGL